MHEKPAVQDMRDELDVLLESMGRPAQAKDAPVSEVVAPVTSTAPEATTGGRQWCCVSCMSEWREDSAPGLRPACPRCQNGAFYVYHGRLDENVQEADKLRPRPLSVQTPSELVIENEMLRRCVAFYAKKENWIDGLFVGEEGQDHDPVADAICMRKQHEEMGSIELADCGDTARECLAALAGRPVVQPVAVKEQSVSAARAAMTPEEMPKLDAAELWEIVFGVMKGEVPEELTDPVLKEIAEEVIKVFITPRPLPAWVARERHLRLSLARAQDEITRLVGEVAEWKFIAEADKQMSPKQMHEFVKEGAECRRTGKPDKYPIGSTQHFLIGKGWLCEDLRIALCKASERYRKSQPDGDFLCTLPGGN